MPIFNFNKPKIKTTSKGVGYAVLGLSSAGTIALNLLIEPWEGNRACTYIDPVGIPTVCAGVTDPAYAVPGACYSDAECSALNATEVAKHESGLDDCLTYSPIPDFTKAAFVSWTYNNGVGAACRSTLIRKANAGDLHGACEELPRWVFAGGQRMRGLENRRWRGDGSRISERTLCLIGLDADYKTPLFERLYVSLRDWITQMQKDGHA